MKHYKKVRWKRRIRTWFRRLVLTVLVAGVGLLIVFAIGGVGIDPVDEFANDTASPAISAVNESLTEEPINRTKVELQIHTAINQERAERGLSRLEFNEQIRNAARYHSEDMATEGYFAHESPDGERFVDRYDRVGVNCDVRVSEDMRSNGAENIAYTYADSDVRADNGGTINHDRNETSIARGLVNQWMNSSGHRKNILKPYWQSEGIGVAIAEVDGKERVYATQNFC